MAKAKKLPSGSWRCLVYDYTDESGKRHYKSFTSSDQSAAGRREVEYQAAEYAANKEQKKQNTTSMSLLQAYDNYIESRSAVLSPGTIREYKRSQKKDLQGLMNIDIINISQDLVQREINKESEKHSPKTMRNIHGLLTAVLASCRPDLTLRTTLPKKVRPVLYIPTDSDVKSLMEYVQGKEMEVPILLAAFGPMRRGEICALKYEDIAKNVVHVHHSLALDENKNWIEKAPKTASSDRYIDFPQFVIDKIGKGSGNITTLTPDSISHRFKHILTNAGISHFRFHDLRHYCASIQHAIGIPDVYIMQRGGWATDTVLKEVYRHTLADKVDGMNQKANDHFSTLCNTKCNTK